KDCDLRRGHSVDGDPGAGVQWPGREDPGGIIEADLRRAADRDGKGIAVPRAGEGQVAGQEEVQALAGRELPRQAAEPRLAILEVRRPEHRIFRETAQRSVAVSVESQGEPVHLRVELGTGARARRFVAEVDLGKRTRV